MKLHNLGQEYLKTADALTSRIHELNRELKALQGNDLIVMKRRILSLYIDAAECRRCAERLINYNKGDAIYEQNNLQP